MLKQRVTTALVIAPITVALVLLLPSAAFALLIAVLLLVALWEWTRLLGLRTAPARCTVIGGVALLFALLWWQRDAPLWWTVIGLGAAWWLIALAWLRNFSFAAAPTPHNTGIKLVAGALIVVPSWAALIEIHRDPHRGHAWALLALVLVWAADSFAYLAGSRYGTTKLAPRISPGKTIAGVWGALAGSVVIALAGGWWLGERGFALVILLGVALVSVGFSIVGDLFESLIKRQANMKDSGTLFPGHGGLFDRLDSAFALMPVFALGKCLLDLYTGA